MEKLNKVSFVVQLALTANQAYLKGFLRLRPKQDLHLPLQGLGPPPILQLDKTTLTFWTESAYRWSIQSGACLYFGRLAEGALPSTGDRCGLWDI